MGRDEFVTLIERHRALSPGVTLSAPIVARLLEDQLSPVLVYRRLVASDERVAPSFLLESVEGGERAGRHSILGAQPIMQVVAYGNTVTVHDERQGGAAVSDRSGDPLLALRELTRDIRLVHETHDGQALPKAPLGGWFGYAAYDTVRYAEPEKLGRDRAPEDDRRLPELHFALYDGVVCFDHVDKLVHVVKLSMVAPDADPGAAFDRASAELDARVELIQRHDVRPLPSGRVDRVERGGETEAMPSNMTRAQHRAMVDRALEYIRAGDIFQVVLGQRFEREAAVDPFDVYRSLRVVNPSPYMVYLQTPQAILVASSPEILCRVRTETDADGSEKRVLTNRPLAGTRRRGVTPEEDRRLEAELLADQKERAEHVMLVDLGRNDVGRVCVQNTVHLDAVFEVERYSHVMHISSTVTGELREDFDAWDALRATLPVGTISGAPKIRAMQIIDELEPLRRGPYGGGMGYVGLDGDMDIALALRTMVAPTERRRGDTWTYHIQAAGGIVHDSQPDAEFDETVNKAAALGRAIALAERAFARDPGAETYPASDGSD
ncbi:MAG: chorismate-binding protein [Planctomycetota bacterium]